MPYFVRVDSKTLHVATSWREVLDFVSALFDGFELGPTVSEPITVDVFQGASDDRATFVKTLRADDPEARQQPGRCTKEPRDPAVLPATAWEHLERF